MRFDCHMHTPLCGHASGTPMEFLREAVRKEIKLLTFTCHIPIDLPEFGGPTIRMREKDFPYYLEYVEKAREMGQGMGVDVLCGIEAEVFPVPDVQERIAAFINANNFDFVLGSLHHQLKSYKDHLIRKNRENDPEIIAGYFEELAEGAKTGIFNSIAHPDVIRIYGTVEPFDPAEYETPIKHFLATCASSNTCIEVNTSGLTKGIFKLHPDPLILQWALQAGVELTIGSDAHKPQSVGQYFDQTLRLIRETGFKNLNYFVRGQRQKFPVTGMLTRPCSTK